MDRKQTCSELDDSKKFAATYHQNVGDAVVFHWETFHRGMGNAHPEEPRLLLALNYGIQQKEGSLNDVWNPGSTPSVYQVASSEIPPLPLYPKDAWKIVWSNQVESQNHLLPSSVEMLICSVP